MQQESLKNKTIKGVGWSALDAVLGQGALVSTKND